MGLDHKGQHAEDKGKDGVAVHGPPHRSARVVFWALIWSVSGRIVLMFDANTISSSSVSVSGRTQEQPLSAAGGVAQAPKSGVVIETASAAIIGFA
jgi:hypothetical protein